MDQSSSCFRCTNSEEDTLHDVWHCATSQQVWHVVAESFNTNFVAATDGSVVNWLIKNLDGKSEAHQAIFALSVWVISSNRNMELHDGTRRGTSELLASIQRHVQEVSVTKTSARNAQNEVDLRTVVESRGRLRGTLGVAQWRKPPEGWYKLNSDGALNVEKSLIGIGAVIHDSNGSELGGLAKAFPGEFNSLTIEGRFSFLGKQVRGFVRGSDLLVERREFVKFVELGPLMGTCFPTGIIKRT